MTDPMLVAEERPLDVSALRARLEGDVAVPGDADWDEARLAWNLAAENPNVSGMTMGPKAHGLLSADGRYYVRHQRQDD